PHRTQSSDQVVFRHESANIGLLEATMPRIFDNIENQLLPALRETLELSHRADVSVGYFNLRGWGGLADQVERLGGGEGRQCRVLIGMQRTPDEEIHALYSLASSPDGIDQQ